MGYAYLIMRSLGFPAGYEDYFNLGVTLRHTSAVNTYLIQCLRGDLGMPSTFHVKERWIWWYLNVEEIDPAIATMRGLDEWLYVFCGNNYDRNSCGGLYTGC